MKEEIWKDIPGYEGLYQASTYGRVKGLNKSFKIAKNAIVHKKESIIKFYITNRNYCRLTLCNNGIKKTYQLHQLIALTFIPNPNNYKLVMHLDDNPLNNNVDNLRWGSQKQNMHDMISKNRKVIGENVGNSKLKNEDVLEIRKKYIPNIYSTVMLAKEYNVNQALIHRIIKRKVWKHI